MNPTMLRQSELDGQSAVGPLCQPTAEVAWVIGVPWQGRGYATEAAQALVAWLEGVGVTTITAHIHPDHEASAVVASRAGLSPTTELEDGERVWRRTMFPG